MLLMGGWKSGHPNIKHLWINAHTGYDYLSSEQITYIPWEILSGVIIRFSVETGWGIH